MRVRCDTCHAFVAANEAEQVVSAGVFVCKSCRAKKTAKREAPKVGKGRSMQLDFADTPAPSSAQKGARGKATLDDSPASGPAEPVSVSDLETVVDDGRKRTDAARGSAGVGAGNMITDEETAPVSLSDLETYVPDSGRTEPVSLRELEMILAPGAEPPSLREAGKLDDGPPSEEVPKEWVALSPPMTATPRAPAVEPIDRGPAAGPKRVPDAPPPQAPPARGRANADRVVPAPRDSNARDLDMMAALSAPPPAPPAASKPPQHKAPSPAKPAPAPAPPVVAAAPPKPPPLPEPEEIEPAPDSRMTDLRRMISLHPDFAPDSERPPPSSRRSDLLAITKTAQKGSGRPPKPKKRGADDEMVNLSGGLFGDASITPIAPPDFTAPLAPTESLPPISSSVPKTEPETSAKQKKSAPPSKASKRAAAASASEARPAVAATPAQAQTSGSRVGIWIGLAAAAAAAWFFVGRGRLDTGPGPQPTAATTTARSDLAPMPVTSTVQPAKPSEEPSLDDTPVGASAKPTAQPSAVPTTPTAAPVVAATTSPATPVVKTSEPAVSQPETPVAKTSEPAPTPPPAPTATEAPPAPAGPEFDTGAAKAALSAAASAAAGCKAEGDPSGVARVSVTFAPSGRVTSAIVNGPPFAGTATGGCIATRMRGASVPPFEGAPVTVHKTVSIP